MVNIIYFLLLIFFPHFIKCNIDYIHNVIFWEAMTNLYVVPIATFDEIITQNECPIETINKCLLSAFTSPLCIPDIFDTRISSPQNTKTNEILFMNHLRTCAINEVKKSIKFQFTALSRFKHSSGGIFGNVYSIYPQCMSSITRCFDGTPKCVVPSQYNVFDKIIKTCSEETFAKLNLTFLPSTNSPITTYIEDIETQKMSKIGVILDSYTSKLPSEVIETFGNLTYEEFEALKIISAHESAVKQFLCGLSELVTYEDVKKRLSLSFGGFHPQFPEMVLDLHKKLFTPKIYGAVKAMLKIHPHLRWSFCSSIFAISPSKEMTNIFSPPATNWALQHCRTLADNSPRNHSAICDTHGINLFG